MLLKDFEKSEEINHFSQESNDLITLMDNDEIFEVYETSSKRDNVQIALHIGNFVSFLHTRKMHDRRYN